MASQRLALAVALAAVALFPHLVPAADRDLLYEFSTDPVEAKGKLANLLVRPNTGQPYYLFLRNASDDTRDVTVQIFSADGLQKLSEGKLRLPQTAANKQNPAAVRVMLAKVAPPMPANAPAPPVPAAPVATPPPVAPPMAPPPPPGVELGQLPKTEGQKIGFVIRIFDDRDKEKPNVDTSVVVDIGQPTNYVGLPTITYVNTKSDNQLTAKLKLDAALAGAAPCPVELVFPPQRALNVNGMHEGVFKRNLTATNPDANLYARDLPLRGKGADLGVFYVNVDGVPRAYFYRYAFSTETTSEGAIVTQLSKPAIRFMEAEKLAPPIDLIDKVELITRPRIVPIRVEADTTSASARFELRVKRLSSTEVVETISKDATRERHAWLDAASMDGGVLVTTRVSDWVIPLDLRDLRGHYILQAELFGTGNAADENPRMQRSLIVDDTKPEQLSLEVLPGTVATKVGPPKHVRSRPLPVRVFASDPESGITKVVVYFGKPGPDGKLPEGFVVATPPHGIEKGWTAQLPLPAPAPPPPPGTPPIPPEQRGIYDLTGTATNGVGLSETVSVRIQLIDPPTGGTIKGKVAMSTLGKGLGGVPVILRSLEDGREKGATKTDDKGEFTFEDVAPGGYRLYASRPDSGVGTKGTDDVRVRAGDPPAKSLIILTRRP